MTPMQVELHQARQARLSRMGGGMFQNLTPMNRVRRVAMSEPPKVAVPVPIKPLPVRPEPKQGFWFRILPDDLPPPIRLEDIKGPIRVEHVQRLVADYFDLRREEIVSARRAQYAVIPRQVAMYLCRQALLNNSMPEIGRRFNRDHTTVLHAVRKMEVCAQGTDILGCAIRHLERQVKEAVRARKSGSPALSCVNS